METWVEIKEAPGYIVSNLGRVKNKITGRILKPYLNRAGGYERVNINNKHYYIHKLVMNSFFVGGSDRKIRHIDRDKSNNHIANLEYF